jgi:predicted glycogen debranching enzyme
MKNSIIQNPPPGKRLLHFCGDRIHFSLKVPADSAGEAFIRTNLGHARITRQEIIRHVEENQPRLGREWFDIPMNRISPDRFEANLGLTEVGHFEAKCLFLPSGRCDPLWPAGENTTINVEPADTCCGNIIYNAFVRQFGPYKNKPVTQKTHSTQTVQALDKEGYTVIPPSGTFRDLIAELDFIMERLGCRLLQLLPIHPTPTTYARMGRYGSPYAALSFTDVDPALAVFDPTATPLEQFVELVDAVHAHQGKLIIDMAINHTGWAASLHETHPQWLAREQDGKIENPGAWGVVWADLTRLDYTHQDMWVYMADVLLTWCRRGVDGFRCDAGYMIPVPAWQYMIAKVRDQFPETLFFLEGLGGKISVTRDLLNRAGFNWAYSELFQNYDRSQIESYLPTALDISTTDGLTVHFAETHDNNRLAATSHGYARMRTALCALLSPNGAFAFANGVEWLATEKINVHEACALNWGAEDNQVENIARLTVLLKTHPAFGHPASMELITHGHGNYVVVKRTHIRHSRMVVVVANLDWEHPVEAGWHTDRADFNDEQAIDLLTENVVRLTTKHLVQQVQLTPGQVLCLAAGNDPWLEMRRDATKDHSCHAQYQRLRAKALEVMGVFGTTQSMNPDKAVGLLQTDPHELCRRISLHGTPSRVIDWEDGVDLRRHVMVPPDHFLLLRSKHPFHVRITEGDYVCTNEKSMAGLHGCEFALITPKATPSKHVMRALEITRFTPTGREHAHSELLFLARGSTVRVQTNFQRHEFSHRPLNVLGTNHRGAMMRVHADWHHVESRYDAILAANLDKDHPEDRRIMCTRCRGWIVYQGFSQPLNLNCLDRFGFDYHRGGWWRYAIPSGQGEHIVLVITLHMDSRDANRTQLTVRRLPRIQAHRELDDDKPVTLILRPDIEDRNFHHTTKAFTGPEYQWPQAISPKSNGFTFAPSKGHALHMAVDQGRFVPEPEWYYMVHRPMEAHRGLDPDSDLLGPGYFTSQLNGGQSMTLTARVVTDGDLEAPLVANPPQHWSPSLKGIPIEDALEAALDHYVVRRGRHRTIIAGYPWFLDWGRDTLIAARGLVAAGRLDDVKDILQQLASFEVNGTLPNMIRGSDATNRDTSDAPLWFFTLCNELILAEGNDAFLNVHCSGRSIRQVLADMAASMMAGTPNGIRMDPATGLIYSPAHFTWMDTNHPAGTPRQGYPIEIQALWHAALSLLTRIDGTNRKWSELAGQVAENIEALFWDPRLGYLVDCRHGETGQGAVQCRPDDALRPNQLLALTLGAVVDTEIRTRVLEACGRLLVPGAIRSLADKPVNVPLEIRHQGHLLNNPGHPYWGMYTGDEDTRRKPAYHNGTAWTWPFPLYCEAWADLHGPQEKATALAWLSSSVVLINSHCVGQIPEIVDGDAPHAQRGCDAQAWGVSEVLRVWKKLQTKKGGRHAFDELEH